MKSNYLQYKFIFNELNIIHGCNFNYHLDYFFVSGLNFNLVLNEIFVL